MVLVVALTVACTKSNVAPPTDIPDTQRSYIFFEPEVLKVVETKTTLVDELPKTEGTAFGVIGYYDDGVSIFEDNDNDDTDVDIARVYRSENGAYMYDNLASWQGKTHTFHAFYPYDLLSTVMIGEDSERTPYIVYNQPASAAEMIDILATTYTTEKVSSVKLTFQHLLWAFRVKVQNSQTSEVTAAGKITKPYITITEIKISVEGFSKSANLMFDGSLTSSTEQGTFEYTITPTDGQIESGDTKAFEPLLYIPTNLFKYRISINYTTQGGASDTYTYPASEHKQSSIKKFERGKVYSLTIEKTDDKFFTGGIADNGDWKDAENDIPHTFQ